MAFPVISTVSASSQANTDNQAAYANDKNQSTKWTANATTGWLEYEASEAFVLTGYTLHASNTGGQGTFAPKTWTFEGYNGSTWVTIDTQTNVAAWTDGEARFYPVTGNSAYTRHRINVSANGGGAFLALGEMYLHHDPSPASASPYDAAVDASGAIRYYLLQEAAGASERSRGSLSPTAAASMAGTYTRGATGLVPSDPTATATTLSGAALTDFHRIPPSLTVAGDIVAHPTSLASNSRSLITLGGQFSDGFQFRIEQSGALSIIWWTPTTGPHTLSSAAGSVVVDTTYHLGFEITTGGAKLYIDGAEAATSSTSGGLKWSNSPVVVGALVSTGSSQGFSGRLQKAALYTSLGGSGFAAHHAALTAAADPDVDVAAPTATAAAAAHVPTITGLGLNLEPPTAAATATAHAPDLTVGSVGGLDLFPPAATAAAAALEPTITGASGAPVLPSDGVNLPAPTPVNTSVTLLPVPAPVPAGVTEWPVQVSAHPMPTLSAGTPRMTAALNVQPEPVDYGRYSVFFDGVDVTHLRDVPCEILSHGSARPSGDTAARVSFPQIAPWDQWGVGDLAPFRKDAPVEIGIVRADDSYAFLWEGFWASEGDATGEARESTTLDCEGTFWQADHTIHIPPLHLEPTDIGILIPRALNAVPGRRYAALPEVTTGILSRERGSQTQSVLAYVQDLLSIAWTDDGRQWTLVRVAPYTYRLQLTDITTVHGTITKGAWGVEIDLQRDESTRVDAVYARGVAPSGGVWANWFWPGLDLYTPPPYLYASPATNMTIGATDAGTVSGTGVSDWQRRVNELGYGLTVDGVFNAADAQAARWVQQLRGITVDGIVGPQTWNATWDVGAQALDLTAIRLPLAAKDETEQFLYTANGAVAADNPAWDSGLVRRSIDLNFGADVTKSTARPLAQRYLDMYGEAAWTGRVTISTDPHEGISRLEYREGMNLNILGHDGAPLLVQIADADHGPLSSTFVVDERARDAMAVDAILARDRDARRTPAARPGNPTKLAQLDRNQIVQYEDESKAGVVPRLAINGSAGLWTVVPIFVSQTGSVAKMTFQTSSPATTFCVAIYGRPITANQQAAFVPDPLNDGDGWRDHEVTLLTRYGWIDSWGEPGSRAGYSPWQESNGRAVTGKLTDDAGFPFVSEFGGYLWVAIYAAQDCFIEGRLYPGVPQ